MGKRSILIGGLLLSFVCLASPNAATDRVIAFLTNAHTGVQMRANDWLTEKARSAELFVAFGGLDALVRQSTSTAERYGGFGSIQILDSKKEGRVYVLTAQVRFKDDDRRRKDPSKAVSEDMVWQFRVVNEGGKLLLDF